MFDAGGSGGVLKVIDLGSAEFLQPHQLVSRGGYPDDGRLLQIVHLSSILHEAG
jgi:hypothetical protein